MIDIKFAGTLSGKLTCSLYKDRFTQFCLWCHLHTILGICVYVFGVLGANETIKRDKSSQFA